MSAPEEPTLSPSGNPIYRHKPIENTELQIATGNLVTIESVEKHLTKYVGKVVSTFHEIVSDKIHLDVHLVPPSERFPFHVLCTSGMSDLPMTLPEGVDAPKYAELLICLPANWPLTDEAFKDYELYWPVNWLKRLARLPHDYKTWLGYGHTIPNGDPAEPYAENTQLCCWVVMPPTIFGEDFQMTTFPDGREVAFYVLVPLHKDEMRHKLNRGMDSLLSQFGNGFPEVIDISRPSSCAKSSARSKSKEFN